MPQDNPHHWHYYDTIGAIIDTGTTMMTHWHYDDDTRSGKHTARMSAKENKNPSTLPGRVPRKTRTHIMD
jgi:hypothetical protein